MRRALLLLFISFLTQGALARLNIDNVTIGAIGESYMLESDIEKSAATAADSILSHFTKSTLATSGIYDAERKRFKAMRSSEFFDDSEFAYYVRIKHVVADLIMPKLVVVAYGMIQRPQNVMYWGPYLYETTRTVESLCKQFQCVVTNGRLNFNDVKFLVINEALGKYFDLAKLGSVDWKALLGQLSTFGKDLSWQDIKDDLKDITNTIASIGSATVDKTFAEATNIGKVFHASKDEIKDLMGEFNSVYKDFKDVSGVKDILMQVIKTSDPEGVERLFNVSDYNISQYMTSYIKSLQGQYYRQHYYIKKITEGSRTLVDFKPTVGGPSATWSKNVAPTGWGNEWLRDQSLNSIGVADDVDKAISKDNYPHVKASNQEIEEYVLSQLGWSRSAISSYESQHPGHSIYYQSYIFHEDRINYLGHKGNHNRHDSYCFKSCQIVLTDSWKTDSIVYDEVFDSQTMDKNTFIKKLEARMKQYNQDADDFNAVSDQDRNAESGREDDRGVTVRYELTSDPQAFYTVADAQKVRGCSSVTFVAKCHSGQKLSEGNFSWKENGNQGTRLEWRKSADFAMESTVDYSAQESEGKKFSEKDKEYSATISDCEKKISELDDQLNTVGREMSQAALAGNQKKQQELKARYDDLKRQQDEYKAKLSQTQADRDNLAQAKNDYYADLETTADEDKVRIKSNMATMQSLYQIEWTDEGEWTQGSDLYIFVRNGYSTTGRFFVTYTAKLTLARTPKTLFGIRIHRAILSVEYELTSEQSGETVIETMQVEKGQKDSEVAQMVNKRQQELMQDYPDCVIDMRYNKMEDVGDVEDDEDGIHLLFATDRIELAKEIENKLVQIYSQLQMIERVMYARNTIKDFLRGIIMDYVDHNRRKTVVEQCLYDWRDNAKRAKEIADSLRNDTTGTIKPPSQAPSQTKSL